MTTKIPYANKNWETVGGCDKIKSGCQNCYAVGLINRMNCCQKKQGRYKGLVKNGKCVPLNEDNRAIWPEWAVREMPK